MIRATSMAVLLSLLTWCQARSEGRWPGPGALAQRVLAEHCIACHGADSASRQGDLRLDQIDDSLTERGIVIPHEPDNSGLIARITTSDPELRMPPAASGRALTQDEIDIVVEWIRDGAKPFQHWAFQPLKVNVPPGDGPPHPIDRFLVAELRRRSISPAIRASAEHLVRRLYLDLIGLPPTDAERHAFVANSRSDAVEQLVDHLLARPQYGENMAIAWLDAARYADTNGYQLDNGRDMWAWRDWVVHAYNRNLPFDQFTTAQLAGDLLPEATSEQRIASGFHRNHGLNAEGGTISEEARTEYVMDRTETTGTVWLGLSLECARCHNHKYDPITQREYYQLFALFNQVPEEGYTGTTGNAAPMMPVASDVWQAQVADMESRITALKSRRDELELVHDSAQEQWEESIATSPPPQLPQPVFAWQPSLGTHDPYALRVEGSPLESPSPVGTSFRFDGGTYVMAIGDDLPSAFDRHDPFSIACWVAPDPEASAPLVARGHFRGYDLAIANGRFYANLVHRWDNNRIHVHTKRRFDCGVWHHVTLTYDGSSTAAGISIYVDAQLCSLDVDMDQLTDSIIGDSTLTLASRSPETPYRYVGSMARVRIFDERLSGDQVSELYSSDPVRDMLAIPLHERTTEARRNVRRFYLHTHDREYHTLSDRLGDLMDRRRLLNEQQPTVMVMASQETPRTTHILRRGQYDQPGEVVEPGVLSVFPTQADDTVRNRLDLAEWLTGPASPLTARVAVNRVWSHFFGRGLVATSNDFGVRGSRPSHPELLDWLANYFIQSGWDYKQLVRLIVTSRSYQRSVIHEARDKDPENVWLGRQRRRPLRAENLRDNVLATAGILSLYGGGPRCQTVSACRIVECPVVRR